MLGEERGVGGVAAGRDADHRLAGGEAGRVDDLPAPVEADLGDGVEVHRVQTWRVHAHQPRRQPARAAHPDDQMGVVAAHALLVQVGVDRPVARHGDARHVHEVLVHPLPDARHELLTGQVREPLLRDDGEPVGLDETRRPPVQDLVPDRRHPRGGTLRDRGLVRERQAAHRRVHHVQPRAHRPGGLLDLYGRAVDKAVQPLADHVRAGRRGHREHELRGLFDGQVDLGSDGRGHRRLLVCVLGLRNASLTAAGRRPRRARPLRRTGLDPLLRLTPVRVTACPSLPRLTWGAAAHLPPR